MVGDGGAAAAAHSSRSGHSAGHGRRSVGGLGDMSPTF